MSGDQPDYSKFNWIIFILFSLMSLAGYMGLFQSLIEGNIEFRGKKYVWTDSPVLYGMSVFVFLFLALVGSWLVWVEWQKPRK